jgi:hypothetical protein
MPEAPPPYVCQAYGNEIVVKTSQTAAVTLLTGMGFTAQSGWCGGYLLRVTNDQEKARIFSDLRDAGICFSEGREWNPVEVFQWLRDEGLLTGPFISVGWRGPGEWVLRDQR